MNSGHESSDYYRHRRSERLFVSSITTLRNRHREAFEVTICDLSQCGFMAESAEPMEIGSYVSLDVPGIGPLNAQIRWQIGCRFGGMFLDPIALRRCDWDLEADPKVEVA